MGHLYYLFRRLFSFQVEFSLSTADCSIIFASDLSPSLSAVDLLPGFIFITLPGCSPRPLLKLNQPTIYSLIQHCSDNDSSARALLLVTASVDKLILKKPIRVDTDLILTGVVTWVGRSSLEI